MGFGGRPFNGGEGSFVGIIDEAILWNKPIELEEAIRVYNRSNDSELLQPDLGTVMTSQGEWYSKLVVNIISILFLWFLLLFLLL